MLDRALPFGLIPVLALALACAPADEGADAPVGPRDEPEARSFGGQPLYRPDLADDVQRDREEQLRRARQAYDDDPHDPERIIWLGRRTAYLGRYREAVAIFGRGLDEHSHEARLLRHRGHRWITLRQLDRAIEDLSLAGSLIEGTPDAIEPDGLPNARNEPRSTLQSNIWYHLALAYYLQDDIDRALPAWNACMKVSRNPDMLCATSHWLYMTLRRAGRHAEADALLEPIHADMDVIENEAYHRLLLMYKGEIAAETLLDQAAAGEDGLQLATVGYGVGNWYLAGGDAQRAETIFRRVVDAGAWAAFGHLAAEADLARLDP